MQRLKCVRTAFATLGLLSLAAGWTPLEALESSMRTKPDANRVGIWKSYVPRGVKGEFNNYDPVGLMAGTMTLPIARSIGAIPTPASCSASAREPRSITSRTFPRPTPSGRASSLSE